MDFCSNCGSKISENDAFCNSCGLEISNVSKSNIQQQTQPPSNRSNKLYRSRDDRWIAGVCGGIGKHFGIDPLIIRLIFIFMGGTIVIYILLALLLEEEPYN